MRLDVGAFVSVSLAIASLMAFSATDARALSRFDVVSTTTSLGNPLDALVVGETVTIGIRISEGRYVFGLFASVWNYDESVINFVRGRAVPMINFDSCFSTPLYGLLCYPPLANNLPGDLVESRLPGEGNRVSFFNGIALSPSNSNPLDPGLDGVIGGGDAQFRVTFVATGLGSTTLVIGFGYPDDGELANELDTSGRTPVSITVVPEPGAAILLGLGLIVLAASRRSPKA